MCEVIWVAIKNIALCFLLSSGDRTGKYSNIMLKRLTTSTASAIGDAGVWKCVDSKLRVIGLELFVCTLLNLPRCCLRYVHMSFKFPTLHEDGRSSSLC